MVPFIVAATILSFILWFGNHYILPRSTKKKSTFENTYIFRGNKKTLNDNVHFMVGADEKAFVRYFRLKDSTMIDFRLEKFKDQKLQSVLKAKRLKYVTQTGKWSMKDYTIRTFDGLTETFDIMKGEQKDTSFAFTPDYFIRYSNEMEMMTSPDIRRHINDQKSKGLDTAIKHQVEYYRRTADPFTIIILTIIGVSLASRKVRGGLGLNLALGLGLGSLYVLISKFSITFAHGHSLPPLIGIWLPNVVFTILAIYLFFRAQK